MSNLPAEYNAPGVPVEHARQPEVHTFYADDPTGGRLLAWADAARAANQLARALVNTSFVPRVKATNGQMVPISEGDATAQILMGDELGLSPLAALRSLFVVHGTPSMFARTMVALVQSHGHEVWTEATSDASVTVSGRRKGSTHTESVTWTTARAAKAKYTNNPKYSSNPQEMLYAKASAEVCRKIAADVLAGIPATVEELELSEPEPTVTVTRTTAPATKAQRKPAAAPVEPAEPPLEPGSTPAAELRSDAQMRLLWKLAKDAGMDEAAFRLYLNDATGREIESTKDITKDEARRLIDELEPKPDEPVDAEAYDENGEALL